MDENKKSKGGREMEYKDTAEMKKKERKNFEKVNESVYVIIYLFLSYLIQLPRKWFVTSVLIFDRLVLLKFDFNRF